MAYVRNLHAWDISAREAAVLREVLEDREPPALEGTPELLAAAALEPTEHGFRVALVAGDARVCLEVPRRYADPALEPLDRLAALLEAWARLELEPDALVLGAGARDLLALAAHWIDRPVLEEPEPAREAERLLGGRASFERVQQRRLADHWPELTH